MPFLHRFLLSSILLWSLAGNLSAGQAFLREASEANVNRRYVIESVSVAGVEVDRMPSSRIPATLRQRLKSLVGKRCDVAALEDLSAEIRRQLHFRTVTEHLSRGSAPDRIRVDFDVVRRDLAFDVSVPRFLLSSSQGFTGEVDAGTRIRQNDFTVGLVSNGDDLTERYTGIQARYDSAPLGSDRIRFGVTVEDYHEQWTEATRDAETSGVPDLYRSRWDVAPEFTFALARPLTVSFGTSFARTDSESSPALAHSVNAATFDVHYGHKIEGGMFGSVPMEQQIEGRYSLRAATRALGSTYAYARHLISAKYEAKTGRHTVTDRFTAGGIAGQAPLFDRFALGNSETLRGWDRFEIDPLGGSRVVHNEIAYGLHLGENTVEGFYDAGAVWQPDRGATLRHSLGVGLRQGVFNLSMAFPIRNGRVEPIFVAGMNY